jgi:hypothetical protein
MWDLDKTTDRNDVWKFMTSVMEYLDTSLTIVTEDELRKILEARGVTQFSSKLLMSMVVNSNITCFEAPAEKSDNVRYFASTKFKQFEPSSTA